LKRWDAEESIGNYFTFYNNNRHHSALDDKTPGEVYFNGKRSLKGGMDNKMGVREPNLKKANFCLNNGGRFRRKNMDRFMKEAFEEAKKGLQEGGIPIGAVLVIDGKIVGRGHNRRVQKGSAILHAEMDCLENAGRLHPFEYRKAVLYSTLSPCDMCSGAVLLYKIPKVVIGENKTFQGPEEYLRRRGVELEILNSDECIELMEKFIKNNPELWNEDIGEVEKAG